MQLFAREQDTYILLTLFCIIIVSYIYFLFVFNPFKAVKIKFLVIVSNGASFVISVSVNKIVYIRLYYENLA